MCRVTVHETNDYCVELEYAHEELFVHCHVDNFNKKVFTELCDLWFDMEDALREEGFTSVLAIPEKKGLVTMMGWDYLTTIEINGKEREVFKWVL